MSSDELHASLEKLEELSALFVSADITDLQALAQIHTHYEELEKISPHPKVRSTARQCADLTEQVILEERNGPDSMSILSEYITEMKRTLDNAGKGGQSFSENDSFHNEVLGMPSAEDIFVTFLSQQVSVMESLEEEILSLEKGNGADEIKRILHTLKGEAGALGLQDVERLCHESEDYLGRVQGERTVEILLKVKDWLNGTFNAYAGKCEHPESVGAIIPFLNECEENEITENNHESVKELPSDSEFLKEINVSDKDTDVDLLEDFVHEAGDHLQQADDCLMRLESNSGDKELINELFRAFHTIKGIAGFLSLEAIQSLAHSTENLLSHAREGKIDLDDQISDILFTSVDSLKKEIETLREALTRCSTYIAQDDIGALIIRINEVTKGKIERQKLIGEVLISQGKVTSDQVTKALRDQKQKPQARIGELLVDQGVVSAEEVADALTIQSGRGRSFKVKEKIKVDTDKLDRLVDIIGELVITEAMVTGDKDLRINLNPRTERNFRQLDKITRQLQEIGLSMRMVSLKSTFQKMARLIRDLARKGNKEINFITSGEDTELDKSVIEHIGDPLIHMVRNSADHGIESSQERVRAGKPKTGTIHLRAYQKGGSICIEVEDDGKGLDSDAILKKAVEKKLVKDTDELSEQEIHQLIFHPGFSTAKSVTDISGRGVGMDVVKRNVESLRGRISIRSQKGHGTVFTIHLPLTLAIMDGMVVTVGEERYIIPTVSIIESYRPLRKDVSKALGRGEMVDSHGQLVPVLHLSDLFGIRNTVRNSWEGIVIITEDKGRRIGFLVDSILGQQQTVIKSIDGGVDSVKGVSGAAIMPDGQVSLIIDISALIKDNEGDELWESEESITENEI